MLCMEFFWRIISGQSSSSSSSSSRVGRRKCESCHLWKRVVEKKGWNCPKWKLSLGRGKDNWYWDIKETSLKCCVSKVNVDYAKRCLSLEILSLKTRWWGTADAEIKAPYLSILSIYLSIYLSVWGVPLSSMTLPVVCHVWCPTGYFFQCCPVCAQRARLKPNVSGWEFNRNANLWVILYNSHTYGPYVNSAPSLVLSLVKSMGHFI